VAHSKSAQKRIRQSGLAAAVTQPGNAAVKEAIRQFDAAVAEGNTDEAAEKLKVAYKRLDTIAARGTIHKNAAARAKSRLATRLNRAASK